MRCPQITPCIARRSTPLGSGLSAVRHVVERTFARLHQDKRLRTRYERRADLHLALMQLACALICHRKLSKPLGNELRRVSYVLGF
jgi:transposase